MIERLVKAFRLKALTALSTLGSEQFTGLSGLQLPPASSEVAEGESTKSGAEVAEVEEEELTGMRDEFRGTRSSPVGRTESSGWKVELGRVSEREVVSAAEDVSQGSGGW